MHNCMPEHAQSIAVERPRRPSRDLGAPAASRALAAAPRSPAALTGGRKSGCAHRKGVVTVRT